MNILESMISLEKTLAILTFDYLASSTYNSEINKLEEFKFLKFIRNGAAHSNVFNLKDENGDWKLKESETVIWSNKRINRSLQGKKVFNDFMTMPDIFLLVNYFSKKLKEIDKK